jgi:hypothetical protein
MLRWHLDATTSAEGRKSNIGKRSSKRLSFRKPSFGRSARKSSTNVRHEHNNTQENEQDSDAPSGAHAHGEHHFLDSVGSTGKKLSRRLSRRLSKVTGHDHHSVGVRTVRVAAPVPSRGWTAAVKACDRKTTTTELCGGERRRDEKRTPLQDQKGVEIRKTG